ncbi:MAG: sugar phosphate isomerase/epimerase [bacterium]|nr:sugar phosphate isomerase/epimerase [bacterium]
MSPTGRRISCCAWALDGSEAGVLTQLHTMGLRAVDIRPGGLRSSAAQSQRAALALDVCCVAASHELPEGAALDSTDAAAVEAARRHIENALRHAAACGADCAYIVPQAPIDADSLDRYAAVLPGLADHGAQLGVRLCIEHFPGTALPTVAATLSFLQRLQHANLYLLFDIGHAQMSQEDPREALTAAGDRLGYVHLDDNDGIGDLHLALADGLLTPQSLTDLFTVLDDVGYAGPVSLEMKGDLPDPADAIQRSFAITQQLLKINQETR